MSTHKRQFKRSSVIWKGTFHDETTSFECLVLNLSADGARVQFVGPMQGAETGTLRIPEFGDFNAKIMWRKDTLAGLQFLDIPPDFVEAISKVLPEVGS